MKVLAIEQAQHISDLLKNDTKPQRVSASLEYVLNSVSGLDAAEQALTEMNFDLIVLDSSLWNSADLESIERLRSHNLQVPLLVIAAPDCPEPSKELLRANQGRFLSCRDSSDILLKYLSLLKKNRELEQDLLAAQEEASAMVEAKHQIISNVGHEMRTPLNSILGFMDLALSEELSPQLREYLETTRKNGDSLLGLINDVLDFSKLESGKMHVEMNPGNLESWLHHDLSKFESLAHEQGLLFSSEVKQGVPENLALDWTKLVQVVKQLLDNAIKFTESGTVSFCVERDEGDIEKGSSAEGAGELEDEVIWLHLSVRDGSESNLADRQGFIFQPFWQDDSSATRKFGGLGLGLALASQLVELMNGAMWVEAHEEKGNVFHVLLPAKVM